MKKIRLGIPVSIFLALCTLGLTACSQQTSAAQTSSGETSQAASAESGSSSAKNEIFGKVTAVDGSKITLALGTMGRGFGNGTGQRRQGVSSGESGGRNGTAPQGGQNANSGGGENPPAGSGNPGSQNSSGKNAPRGMGGMITLSGETTTITVSDSSVIKKMERGARQSSSGSSGQASGSLSDIKVGTILGIEKDSSGAVTSITILSGFGGRGNSASSSN